MERNIVIIFAGGTGTRMNRHDNLPKQFLLLDGKPVIIHTIELFERHAAVTDIVVVCLESRIDELHDLLNRHGIHKVKSIVPGGQNTQESIFHGLCEAEKLMGGENAVVLIHDGVRPLINAQTITDNIESVLQHGTAITCATPTETIVINSKMGIEVPRRSALQVVRAPQSFWINEILSIHRQAIEDDILDFVDCCEMMHHYGHSMNMVQGPEENLKITTVADFYMCEALLKLRKNNEQQ